MSYATFTLTFVFLVEGTQNYFTNLRTRYTCHRKKLQNAKVSGSGSDHAAKVKDEVEDMFLFLSWLDPFYKPRKTSSNVTIVDSGNEASEDDEIQNVDDKSDSTETTASDADGFSASNNFRSIKKVKLPSKKKTMAKVHDDVTMAEVHVLQSLGDALGHKQMQVPNANTKDEDELFGELIASQMRQLLPEGKVMVKMQVSNILYQEMLAKFQSPSTPAPAPFTQGQIQVEMYQPQQHQQYQPQHHHNFQDKNQMQKRPFPVPRYESSEEHTVLTPGQLFYHNKSQMGYLDNRTEDQCYSKST